ncbi:TPA: hypothetical protein MNA20_002258 [Klebsiella pneumoniae]|nr:hypothetical protein [Klebsiella pneumoniae]
MGLGQTAQSGIADEATWVAKYVAMGGDEREGRGMYQRMKQAQENSPYAVALPPKASDKLKDAHLSSDTGNQPLFKKQVIFNGHDPDEASPSAASVEADLFHDLPIPPQQPQSQQATLPAQQDTPQKKKRGRPAVNWSDRPKRQGELDLFQLSLEIEEKPAKDHNQLGVIATAMIYASLPHSEIEGAVFKRRNGDLSLTILNDPDIGLPYGKMPRLITAFLCTEAKRTKEPVISLGRSKNEFAKKLGLGTGGGPRGDLTRLTEQAKRLFTSHITLIGAPDSQFHWRNVNLTDSGMLLWNPHDPDAKSPWESQLTLSQKFFDECIAHSVPIDLRVLHKLRSPLAIDIYIWMTYRYNSISAPTPISWKQLKWQFGANYADDEQGLKNFITSFKTCLRMVSSVYREAKFRTTKDTLTLLPSPPHVLPSPD